MFEITSTGSRPKPAWVAETETLWQRWCNSGPELEAAKLRRQIAPRGQDQDRQLGPRLTKLGQDAKAVEPGQEEIEDDQVVLRLEGLPKPDDAVLGTVDHEALGLEPVAQELPDPGLVFDNEDPHVRIPHGTYRAGSGGVKRGSS